MARLDNSILKGLRGKVGEIIIYEAYGQTLVRARPGKYKKTKSIPLQIQRQRLTVVQKFLKCFRHLIKRFYQPETEGKTAYGDAVSWNMKNALIGQYPDLMVDPAKVRFVNGALPVPAFTHISLVNNMLNLTWVTTNDLHGDAHDVLQVVVLPVNGSVANDLDALARRADGQLCMNIPEYFNVPKHLWVFFYSVRTGKVSQPVYLGLF
ncbi:hypothetical protein LX69_02634 [Breznakibacter xylanolyticus]|uniref:Uncharacterized protein n=1 Tax=Breznakibacter xylanolyticus TaxID=990 RepID=A0A2W7N177_9BACT|nr:DUF6266 family protein [Breznakibacter xylanolyticus]PZX13523.1 hypothetical protein LX69_02634 [Breznakibacter xylanolyticus]